MNGIFAVDDNQLVQRRVPIQHFDNRDNDAHRQADAPFSRFLSWRSSVLAQSERINETYHSTNNVTERLANNKKTIQISFSLHQTTYLTPCERQKIGMMQRPLVEKHKLAGLHLQINAAARVFLSWRKASGQAKRLTAPTMYLNALRTTKSRPSVQTPSPM
ncbi:hypothetical protein C6495_08450 [Candidatus Poribacteria bacterium]|nr:MAG: hypothetical protein C6495_08450 [Candidatus Poribacteria bacterium]